METFLNCHQRKRQCELSRSFCNTINQVSDSLSASVSLHRSEPQQYEFPTRGIQRNSLSAAIKRFNATNFRADGKKQPPLTEDEVIAAILHQQTRRDEHDVSDSLFERLQNIARTRILPEGVTFEVIPTFGTEGDTTTQSGQSE